MRRVLQVSPAPKAARITFMPGRNVFRSTASLSKIGTLAADVFQRVSMFIRNFPSLPGYSRAVWPMILALA